MWVQLSDPVHYPNRALYRLLFPATSPKQLGPRAETEASQCWGRDLRATLEKQPCAWKAVRAPRLGRVCQKQQHAFPELFSARQPGRKAAYPRFWSAFRERELWIVGAGEGGVRGSTPPGWGLRKACMWSPAYLLVGSWVPSPGSGGTLLNNLAWNSIRTSFPFFPGFWMKLYFTNDSLLYL